MILTIFNNISLISGYLYKSNVSNVTIRDGPDSRFVGYLAILKTGYRISDEYPVGARYRISSQILNPVGYRIFQCLFLVRQSCSNN